MDVSIAPYKITVFHKGERRPINLNMEIRGTAAIDLIAQRLADNATYQEVNKELEEKAEPTGTDGLNEFQEIVLHEYHSRRGDIYAEQVTVHDAPYYKEIYITVSKGKNGDIADVHINGNEEAQYQINIRDKVSRRLQMYLALPLDNNVYAMFMGCLNLGRYGAKTLFSLVVTKAIKEVLEPEEGEVTVKIAQMGNYDEIMRLVESSPIDKMVITNYGEVAGELYSKRENIFYMPDKNRIIRYIRESLKTGRAEDFVFAEIPFHNIGDFKIVIDIGNGKKRTIGIKNVDTTSIVLYLDRSINSLLNKDQYLCHTKVHDDFRNMAEEYIPFLNRVKE